MLYVNVPTTDPALNLAMEEHFFSDFDEDVFMLWQNDNTIVVGRYQDTMAEINADYVRAHQVHVVRRMSGGGAVYHDLGNVNFTFITKADEKTALNFRHFEKTIIDMLAEIGVAAEYNSRNDIVIDGKKFSGNSQYIRHGRVLHHGTLMFDSDLDKVVQALHVSDVKMRSKAIRSIHERVTTVAEHLSAPLSLEAFKQMEKEFILRSFSGIHEYALTKQDWETAEKLKKERYGTWEWTYGKSPACEIEREARFPGGTVQLRLALDRGRISSFLLQGDFFTSRDIEEDMQCMQECRFTRDDLAEPLASMAEAIAGMERDWLQDFVFGEARGVMPHDGGKEQG
ncbi:MAG: lipoate--protein ligase [Eubacteriales bacterium]|nr:lipoate--protein ligase [Eubacteriales bacterium]